MAKVNIRPSKDINYKGWQVFYNDSFQTGRKTDETDTLDKQKMRKSSSTGCSEGIYAKKVSPRLFLRQPLTLQTLVQGLCHFCVVMETQRNKDQFTK